MATWMVFYLLCAAYFGGLWAGSNRTVSGRVFGLAVYLATVLIVVVGHVKFGWR